MCLAVAGRLDRTQLLPRDKQEVIDVETFAIFQALRVVDRRQESGHCYTIFVHSTTAIDSVRTDALGPGQSFAIAAMGACDRVLARDDEVTIRWVPAHIKMTGNEQADMYAKAAARWPVPYNDDDYVLDGLLTEARFSHMSCSATEARLRASAEWIASHVLPQRRYRHPPGRAFRR